jgi:hypothetical protein
MVMPRIWCRWPGAHIIGLNWGNKTQLCHEAGRTIVSPAFLFVEIVEGNNWLSIVWGDGSFNLVRLFRLCNFVG